MTTTAPQPAVRTTEVGNAPGGAPLDNAAAGALIAVWCRSVGSAWTLELREPNQDTPLGTIRDWISSGVPISQPPPPQTLARALLAEHGLTLVGDLSTSPGTPTRHPIGYVCAITELHHAGLTALSAARVGRRIPGAR
jgi:hypothetical protein